VDWDNLEVVLHLAAPARLFDFPAQARAIYETSVAATFNLLEAARWTGIRRVLMASTGDVLGGTQEPASEDDLLYQPSSFYGAAKACAELLLRSFQPVISTAVLRFYHPYGPGGNRFLINRLVNRVANSEEVTIEGAEGIRLNPVWIEDLALGVCQAVESDQNGIFHFGGPEYLTLRGLLEKIGRLVGREPLVRSLPGPCIERHAGAFELTRQALGYCPKVSVDEGLRRLVEVSYVA
jgi:nucleoside-diphosphate-sugar epimerase